MYLVRDPKWLWFGDNGFFRTMDSSSLTPSVAVSHHANRHVNRTCQSRQPNMSTKHANHNANHHINEPPSSCRWSWCHRGPRQRRRRPWLRPREPPGGRPSPENNDSRNHHIDLGLVHPQKYFCTFIISIFFDYLSQISKPCWSQNSAHKPIWKRRWCLGTLG